jgi:uncharacterized protein YbjT (DUF2867 family)
MRITIFGGSGFIGKHIVSSLSKGRGLIKVATRDVASAHFLKPYGEYGQISITGYSYHNLEQINEAISGADTVINCVGILQERGQESFQRAHVELPKMIAQAARNHQIKNLIHISALGVSQDSNSSYAQTKAQGEAEIKAVFKNATIIRPSLVFGPEDQFFNRYARMACLLPIVPILGSGDTRFQPVYVGDIAKLIHILTYQADHPLLGKTIEAVGPEVFTFNQLVEKTLHIINRPKKIFHIPLPIAKTLSLLFSLLPNPPFTKDQIKLLELDSTGRKGSLSLKDAGIPLTLCDLILPQYLKRFLPKEF